MSEEESTKILKDHTGINSNGKETLEEPADERMEEKEKEDTRVGDQK